MKFMSRSNRPTALPNNPGSSFAPIHVKAIDEKGYPYLSNHGQKNIQEVIQSHLDDSLVRTIVSKYEAGDNSVLGKLQGFYADISGMPTSLTEGINALNKMKAFFNRQPDSIKQKFGTLEAFIKALGTDELKNFISEQAKNDKPVDKAPSKVIVEEVVTNADK